jgi:hypothetical protein
LAGTGPMRGTLRGGEGCGEPGKAADLRDMLPL